jgi:sterol desaturase/sphingolipid hydroxylase (fatty acid hydroxylase superfamily)
VKDNLLNHLIVGPVMITIPLYNLFQWRSPILVNMSSPIDPKPSNWLKIITQLVFYVLVEDFMFYWTHRFLHWGPIYPYIHKQHHEYKSPVTISAEYAHPIEKLFGNHVPVFMGPLLWPCSPFLSAVWVVLRLSKTIEAHSGYLIPGSPFSSWETWQTTAERHDFHHSNNKGCFGSFLRFWDYIGGTEDDFLKYHRQESTT